MENNDKGITTELIQDILNSVKLVLNLEDTSKDNLLTLYIDIICNRLLIRTNRKVFIPDLKYVVIMGNIKLVLLEIWIIKQKF